MGLSVDGKDYFISREEGDKNLEVVQY